MDTIELGDVTVSRVREYYGPIGFTPRAFVPESSEEVWKAQESWLRPEFIGGEPPVVNAALQTWVLRSEGRVILVDTGGGNNKPRPGTPWDHLETDFLGNLARAGVEPEDVDLVVNTHLHADHVGWNTRLDGGSWVPTFPNADYLIHRNDFEFWNPANGHASVLGDGNAHVFEDSVAPVHEAGRTLLWEGDGHRIDAHLRLELAAGHTPDRPWSPSRPAAKGRRSSATCCTVPCRSWNRTRTAASARIPAGHGPPGAGSSAGRPITTDCCSLRTSAVTVPPKSPGTAAGSPSRAGPPSRRTPPATRADRRCQTPATP